MEDLRFSKIISGAAEECRAEIESFREVMTSRGLLNTGACLKGELKIRVKSVESVVEDAIGLRKALGSKVPELLAEGNLSMLRQRLESYVEHAIEGIYKALPDGGQRDADLARSKLLREVDEKAGPLKSKVQRELHAIALEPSLDMHKKDDSMNSAGT